MIMQSISLMRMSFKPGGIQTWRQHVGNLLILTRDKNRAYQDMIYQKKVECCAGDNILAQALNPTAYHIFG